MHGVDPEDVPEQVVERLRERPRRMKNSRVAVADRDEQVPAVAEEQHPGVVILPRLDDREHLPGRCRIGRIAVLRALVLDDVDVPVSALVGVVDVEPPGARVVGSERHREEAPFVHFEDAVADVQKRLGQHLAVDDLLDRPALLDDEEVARIGARRGHLDACPARDREVVCDIADVQTVNRTFPRHGRPGKRVRKILCQHADGDGRLGVAAEPGRSGQSACGKRASVTMISARRAPRSRVLGPGAALGRVSRPPLAVIAPHWTQFDGVTCTDLAGVLLADLVHVRRAQARPTSRRRRAGRGVSMRMWLGWSSRVLLPEAKTDESLSKVSLPSGAGSTSRGRS
jgi:hypothetical protein